MNDKQIILYFKLFLIEDKLKSYAILFLIHNLLFIKEFIITYIEQLIKDIPYFALLHPIALEISKTKG